MTKEELVSVGVGEDVADKVIELAKKDLAGFVPKERLNEVIAQRDRAKSDLEERDKQIEQIKKATGDNEELKTQIKALQDANKEAAQKAADEMTMLRKQTAVQLEIATDAQDAELVAGLFDMSKIIVDDSGRVVSGLKEQKDEIKKAKPFLFKEPKQDPYKPKNGEPSARNPWAKETYNLTEQGNLIKSNPELAKQYASAAGVHI